MMATIRLPVADDHEVIRRGSALASGNPTGVGSSGEAASGREAVEKAKQLKPDLVVLDLGEEREMWQWTDRKSTRLNSSHGYISYAVFCLKKKKKIPTSATP